MAKGKTYDIKVTVGSTEYPLILAKAGGRREYEMRPATSLTTPVPTGPVGYDHYAPEERLATAQKDLRGGMGQYELDPSGVMADYRYHSGQGLDTRTGRAIPGPAIVIAYKANSASVGGAAYAWAEFGTTRALYCAAGRYVVKWNGSIWAQVDDFGAGKTVTALIAYGSWLIAVAGGSDAYHFSTDGTNWTTATITGRFQSYLAVAHTTAGVSTLWGLNLPNELRGSTDPSNTGSWSAITNVGDSQFNGTSLTTWGTGLVEGKTDGLYATNSSGNIVTQTPDFRSIIDAANCKITTTFGNKLIVAVGKTLYLVNSDFTYDEIQPWRKGGTPDVMGKVTALCHDESYVYAAVTADDATNYIMAGREETLGGTTDWCWHPIIYLGANTTSSLWYSTVDSGLPKLWFGYTGGNDLAYCSMSKDPIKEDGTLITGYTVATSWQLITSWTVQRFEDIVKQFNAVSTQLRNASANAKITLSTQADQESSWTSLGDITAAGITITQNAISRTGRRFRLRIVGTNAASSATAILESFVIWSTLKPVTKYRFRYVISITGSQSMRQGVSRKSAATKRAEILTIINTDAAVALEHVNGTSYNVNFNRAKTVEREGKDSGQEEYETVFEVEALQI